MARIIVATSKKVVVEHKTGRVQVNITPVKKSFALEVFFNSMTHINVPEVKDFVDALRKAATKTGQAIGKGVKLSGTSVDFDEPLLDPSINLTVTGRVFPKNKELLIEFTRFHSTGEVLANIKSFRITDLPSAVQLAHVGEQMAGLMVQYSKI